MLRAGGSSRGQRPLVSTDDPLTQTLISVGRWMNGWFSGCHCSSNLVSAPCTGATIMVYRCWGPITALTISCLASLTLLILTLSAFLQLSNQIKEKCPKNHLKDNSPEPRYGLAVCLVLFEVDSHPISCLFNSPVLWLKTWNPWKTTLNEPLKTWRPYM